MRVYFFRRIMVQIMSSYTFLGGKILLRFKKKTMNIYNKLHGITYFQSTNSDL